MITKTETKYICECCGASLRTKEICEEHEIECKKEHEIEYKKEKEKELLYKERTKYLSENEYIFYGKSIEDVENCVFHNSMGYLDNCNYEDFEYPCFVLLSKHSEPEPYEDYYSDFVSIRLLDEYIKKIAEIKKELSKNN